MKVFSGSSNKPLAGKIAHLLNTKLSPLEIFIFPDGERRITIEERVVDEDVVIVQTTSPDPDTSYMELFFLVDAAKRSGAKNITAVVPYLGYQRQDHVFRDGEAVSLEVIIKTLESTGMDRLITLDLHSIKIPELFKIPILHLSALPIFAKKIRSSALGWSDRKTDQQENRNQKTDNREPITDCILISPDMGGIRRIKILSELLGNMPFAAVVKDRDLSSGDIVSNKFDENGFRKGIKKAMIVDDMISTGKTISAACDLLIENGVEEILVFATHPVFSNDAKNILQNCRANKIYVTDTIKIPEKSKFSKLEVLSVAEEIYKNLKI